MLLLVLFLGAALGLAPAQAAGSPDGADSPIVLLAYEDLAAAIEAVANEHPDVARVLTLGTSREGRRIDALELSPRGDPADEETGSMQSTPAILLVANLDGPDVFDSAVALDHAARLAAGYGSDEAITALLDTTTILVVPRANPDAAEARFLTPSLELETSGRGVDDDRDGRSGEDPPSDVDGDGAILTIRVPDPEGTWIPDPADGRAMIEADPTKGQLGHYRLWPEGRDLDGDERVAEDPIGDTRLNRNFPSGWDEHAEDSGLFPSDEPEARALMEFVMLRKDIALVLCYGAPENLVEKPKAVADDAKPVMRVPLAGMLQSDADLLAELARRYEKTTGNESTREAVDAGSFQRWCYDHRGLMTLSAVLWQMPEEWKEEATEMEAAEPVGGEAAGAGESETVAPPAGEAQEPERAETEDEAGPSTDAKRLEWIDGSGESWRFVDWKPFDHPELGAVEIGGFAPFALREPPRDEWDGIAAKELEFLIGLGQVLPRLEIDSCTATALGGGLWRLEVAIENRALLPLQTRSALRTRTVRPARVELLAPGGEDGFLSGEHPILISDLAGSGGRSESVWLLQTDRPEDVTVMVQSDNAGSATAEPEVVR